MRAKHVDPCVQMRIVLQGARAEGLSFDEGWTRAMGTRRRRGRIVFRHQTADRRFWRATLEAQKPVWHAAYERRECALWDALERLFEVMCADWSESAAPRKLVPEVGEARMAPVEQPFGWSASETRRRSLDRAAAA